MKKITLLSLFGLLTLMLTGCRLFRDIHTFELIDLHHENKVLAEVNGDLWHGELPVLRTRETLKLTANILSRGRIARPLDEEGLINGLSASIFEGAREDVLLIENHGDHVTISAENQGITKVVFHWIKDGEIAYTTPPILLMVYNSPLDSGVNLLAFEVLNLDDHLNRLAYVHGNHWHGRVPTLSLNQTINLTALIIDEDQNEVVFGEHGSNQLRMVFASGANDTLLVLENNHDFITIEALAIGSTQVLFQWIKDGDVYYTSPPMTIRVQ